MTGTAAGRALPAGERNALVNMLEARFARHADRHAGITWSSVRVSLEGSPDRLWSLGEMERTGGEPDVIGAAASGEIIFCDCSPESPAGRRSLCYDAEALDARKENKPAGSALGLAKTMGVELLAEAEYRHLQTLGAFDLKTSSWVQTPEAIRRLGGALFCDRRYDTVFVYHNGAQSYYAARGFRAALRV